MIPRIFKSYIYLTIDWRCCRCLQFREHKPKRSDSAAAMLTITHLLATVIPGRRFRYGSYQLDGSSDDEWPSGLDGASILQST